MERGTDQRLFDTVHSYWLVNGATLIRPVFSGGKYFQEAEIRVKWWSFNNCVSDEQLRGDCVHYDDGRRSDDSCYGNVDRQRARIAHYSRYLQKRSGFTHTNLSCSFLQKTWKRKKMRIFLSREELLALFSTVFAVNTE